MQKRKLTDEQVAEIKALAQTAIKRIDIARKYGISPQLVSTVIRHGYDQRPPRASRAVADPETNDWTALARKYNKLYASEPPLTGPEIKSIHDIALKKIRNHFENIGLTANDLL